MSGSSSTRPAASRPGTGCLEVFSTPFPETSWQIAWLHSLFGNAPAVASGVAAALRAMGRTDIRVAGQGGDGGTVDIGMACLSGMFERNDDVLYILVPYPLGWGSSPADTIKVARLATESGLFPVFEAEAGQVVLALGQDADLSVLHDVPGVTFSGKKAARNIDAWLRGTRCEPSAKHELAGFGGLSTWYYADAPATDHKSGRGAYKVSRSD